MYRFATTTTKRYPTVERMLRPPHRVCYHHDPCGEGSCGRAEHSPAHKAPCGSRATVWEHVCRYNATSRTTCSGLCCAAVTSEHAWLSTPVRVACSPRFKLCITHCAPCFVNSVTGKTMRDALGDRGLVVSLNRHGSSASHDSVVIVPSVIFSPITASERLRKGGGILRCCRISVVYRSAIEPRFRRLGPLPARRASGRGNTEHTRRKSSDPAECSEHTRRQECARA